MTYGKEYDSTTQARLFDDSNYYREADEARDRILRHFGENDQLLEIGCGMGQNIYHARNRASGVEISDHAVARCREKGIEAKCVDAQKGIPFPAGRFDGVIMSHVLEHFQDPNSVMDEACRVLKPDGRMVVCLPSLEIELKCPEEENSRLHHHLRSWSVPQFKEYAALWNLEVIFVERRRKRFLFLYKRLPALYSALNSAYAKYLSAGQGTSSENVFVLKKSGLPGKGSDASTPRAGKNPA